MTQSLEDWLWGVHVLPLRAFAQEMKGVHDAPKRKCIEFILANDEARVRALTSKTIEEKALK